jgi:hypothetical protein
MSVVRRYLLVAIVGLAWLSLSASLRAESIHEPNNSPGAAHALPGGQMLVSDDLNGDDGRPEILLGQYTPTYGSLLAMGSPAPGVGNGLGSQLLGIPLFSNGMAFFRVTGAPDTTFDGSHVQDGQYSVTYQVYDPAHQPVKTVTQYEWVTPSMIDNVWLPPDTSVANWTGYTTDVTVNNVVGPGSGDSLDFFTFSGLDPFMPFTARLTDAGFDALIGLYDGDVQVGVGMLVAGVPTLSGIADATGSVKLGVTGLGDNDFVGAHAETGQYTLEVIPIPEPAGIVLWGIGAALFCLFSKSRLVGRGARGRRV